MTHFGPVAPLEPKATDDPAVRRLVTSDYFLFDEVRPGSSWSVGGDDTCHVVVVLEGEFALDDAWGLPAIKRGRTVLCPAAIGRQTLRSATTGSAKLLHVALP